MSIGLDAEEEPTSLPDTKGSSKKVIRLDVGNNHGTIRDVLLPVNTHMPDPTVFKQRTVCLEEGYLHSTLSSWEGRSAIEKTLIVGSSMYTQRSITFSLRFNHKKGAMLGIALTKAFRLLRNQLGPVTALGPTMMSLERDKQGRPHIHGIVQTDAARAEVRATLGAVSGKATNPRFNLFKVNIKEAANSVTWATYMTKDMLKLPEQESAKLIYMSQSARRRGKEHINELKELSKQKLGIAPDWRGRAAFYGQQGASPIIVMAMDTSGMTRK